MIYIDVAESKLYIDWERFDRDRKNNPDESPQLTFTRAAIDLIATETQKQLKALAKLIKKLPMISYRYRESKIACCFDYCDRLGHGFATSKKAAQYAAITDWLANIPYPPEWGISNEWDAMLMPEADREKEQFDKAKEFTPPPRFERSGLKGKNFGKSPK